MAWQRRAGYAKSRDGIGPAGCGDDNAQVWLSCAADAAYGWRQAAGRPSAKA
jgi:hypothetical protein